MTKTYIDVRLFAGRAGFVQELEPVAVGARDFGRVWLQPGSSPVGGQFTYDHDGHSIGYSMIYASAPVNGSASYNTFTNTLDATGWPIGMTETDQNETGRAGS